MPSLHKSAFSPQKSLFETFRGPVLKTRGNKKQCRHSRHRARACKGVQATGVAVFRKVVASNHPDSLFQTLSSRLSLPLDKSQQTPHKDPQHINQDSGGCWWAHFSACYTTSTKTPCSLRSKRSEMLYRVSSQWQSRAWLEEGARYERILPE